MVSSEWLKRAELFGSLEEPQLNALLSNAQVKSFPEGETIFRQGDQAIYLYILIEGGINLTVRAGEKPDFMTSKIEKEGAVFGMPSLLEPFRYNVTAISLKPTKVLMIRAECMRKNMESDPMMGREVMEKLASIYFNRLNEMRQGISNLLKVLKPKT